MLRRGSGDTLGGRPRRGSVDRGVTLIELMVALAITMIMMTAVVTLFANLSSTVSNSRALIEISERLRAARNRLQLDLAGHTATTLPPCARRRRRLFGDHRRTEQRRDVGAGDHVRRRAERDGGDGRRNQRPQRGQQSVDFVSSASGTDSNGNIVYPGSIMGDADDVLALTVRSSGEPFVGWGWNSTTNTRMLVESPTAEVIWYAVPNGRSLPAGATTTNPNPYPIQLYTLYRRVLLVSPQSVPTGTFAVPFTSTTPVTVPLFYNNLDLSVRSSPGGTVGSIAVGNSLTDLTNRQNRFLHAFTLGGSSDGVLLTQFSGWPQNVLPPSLAMSSFPNPILHPSYTVTSGGSTSLISLLVSVPAALNNATNLTVPANAPTMVQNSRLGEDVILTDVLSFDVRVFDPMAPLMTAATGEVLVPSDPGYVNATGNVAGFGAFVDMGYANLTPTPTAKLNVNPPQGTPAPYPQLQSYFSNFPNAISTASGGYTVSQAAHFNANAQLMPQTYDTFSLGFDQNNFDEDENPTGANGMIDQGADGLDDDPTATPGQSNPDGIVDNVPQVSAPYLVSTGAGTTPTVTKGSVSAGERETLPPYPFPLRGVQVILRVYEPDTRQVRQVTIVQDFLPD